MPSISRIVAVLTPLIFVPVSAAITGWTARHFPGLPPIHTDQLVALEVAGATAAFGMAAHWLHGHQLYTKLSADLLAQGINLADAPTAAPETPDLSLDPADQPAPVTQPAQAAQPAPVPPAA